MAPEERPERITELLFKVNIMGAGNMPLPELFSPSSCIPKIESAIEHQQGVWGEG
jgi:hypothetical protein